jgi:hypothetical protein
MRCNVEPCVLFANHADFLRMPLGRIGKKIEQTAQSSANLMPPIDYYSRTYQTARHRFRAAAAALNAQQEQHTICVDACPDDNLSIDVAWIGSDTPDWTVVISSGLHGVEGFFGSAVQLAGLARLAATGAIKGNGRVVFVHAINPYGFRFLRRVNEDNTDLNRNFLLPDQPYRGRPDGYDRLNNFLNPTSPPPLIDSFPLKALWYQSRQGLAALKSAIAVGQYDYPQGVFFGGNSLALSACVVQANFQRWLGGAAKAIHLDLHTGLGRFGTYKLLLAGSPDQTQLTWCRQHFGENRVEVTVDENGTAYRSRGTMGQWLCHHLSAIDYTYFNAEFGTYPEAKTLGALCADNRAHCYGRPGTWTYGRAKARLMERFCPASKKWRTTCLEQGLALIDLCFDTANDTSHEAATPA